MCINEIQIQQKERELELQESQKALLQELIDLLQSGENDGDSTVGTVNAFREEGSDFGILGVDPDEPLAGEDHSDAENCLEENARCQDET